MPKISICRSCPSFRRFLSVYVTWSQSVFPHFAGYEIEEHDNPADFFLDVILGNKESNIPEIEQENSRAAIKPADDVAVIESAPETADSNGERVSWLIYYVILTLQEKNFHWILNFAILLMAYSLNFNSANYYIFRNHSMIAYIIYIKIS